MLEPDEEALSPAQEAGVLKKILVHEGDQVSADQPLAQIDDAIPLAQRDVAYYKLQAATKKSEDDIDIRFAKMAAKVAKVEYDEAEDANGKVPGTVTHSEVLRRLLDWHKMDCRPTSPPRTSSSPRWRQNGRGRAPHRRGEHQTPPHRRPHLVRQGGQADGRRRRRAYPARRPIGADRRAGDAAGPHGPLRVNGSLKAEEHRPSEIQGCDAEIAVTLPHLGRLTFPGKVTYVKPVVEGGYVQVRAEVENRKQNGIWILNPGMNVEMTVQLK